MNANLWRKPSDSGHDGADCIEVAATPAHVGVRDSMDPAGPGLVFARTEWATFLRRVKSPAPLQTRIDRLPAPTETGSSR